VTYLPKETTGRVAVRCVREKHVGVQLRTAGGWHQLSGKHAFPSPSKAGARLPTGDCRPAVEPFNWTYWVMLARISGVSARLGHRLSARGGVAVPETR
jgi:hypothetical protein